MSFDQPIDDNRSSGELPLNVHYSVVKSLYSNQTALLAGTLSMVIAPIVLFFRTYDTLQLAFACLFFTTGTLRLFMAKSFAQASLSRMGRKELDRWESYYAILAVIYVGTLGLWYLCGFARSSDPFVHTMSLALMLCYLVGITGRNFSSKKVVFWQVIAATCPLIAASVFFGDEFHIVLGAFLLPFFASVWAMSKNLRNMLFSAVFASQQNRLIANRFDAALNSISHGIAMFDENGTVVVSNPKFEELIAHQGETCLGKHFKDLKLRATELRRDRVDGKLRMHNNNLAREISTLLNFPGNKTCLYFSSDAKVLEAGFFQMKKGLVLLLKDVSDRVASDEEIRKLANFDVLTGLANRRYFQEQIENWMNSEERLTPCSVFFVDLDKFKETNDTLGHAVGDKMLVAVAGQLESIMPDDALICRFGGDEFVILLKGVAGANECSDFAEQVISKLGKRLEIDGHVINSSASVGIAFSDGKNLGPDELLQFSDAALYEAKSKGRSGYFIYTNDLGKEIAKRRQLEADLREALSKGELAVFFQPIIDSKSLKPVACEALMRWKHRQEGMIPPDIFIKIAEETGLICQLGEFVLRQSVRECKKWPEHMRVAVNVSSVQFQHASIVKLVKSILQEEGLEASRLELEITESALLVNMDEAKNILRLLSELGVGISLDDFGTGFSSLSYLRTLPLDKIKIDRSFVMDIEDDARSLVVLGGITNIAIELGLNVVVEGIETTPQLNRILNCTGDVQIQGYLFGRPMPSTEIREYLGQTCGQNLEMSLKHQLVAI